MVVQVEETEKGLAVILPEEVVHGSHLAAGTTIDLTLTDDQVQITPVRRSKYKIEDLMAGVTDENLPDKIDFGPPIGKELL